MFFFNLEELKVGKKMLVSFCIAFLQKSIFIFHKTGRKYKISQFVKNLIFSDLYENMLVHTRDADTVMFDLAVFEYTVAKYGSPPGGRKKYCP